MMSNIEFLLVSPLYKKDLKSYIYPSVEGWIKSFSDADFIVENSFHSTVFSIIFNKPFISIVNKERGASRFESLLGQLGLTNRMVNEISTDLIHDKINYELVNRKLMGLKYKSIDYLNKVLG